MSEFFYFSGKAKRQEYWGVIVVTLLLTVFPATILMANPTPSSALFFIASMLMIGWVQVATTVRRLRDAGLSLFWILSLLIPYVGWIAFIVFGVVESETE